MQKKRYKVSRCVCKNLYMHPKHASLLWESDERHYFSLTSSQHWCSILNEHRSSSYATNNAAWCTSKIQMQIFLLKSTNIKKSHCYLTALTDSVLMSCGFVKVWGWNCLVGWVSWLWSSYEEWKKKYKIDDRDSDGETGGAVRGRGFGGTNRTFCSKLIPRLVQIIRDRPTYRFTDILPDI